MIKVVIKAVYGLDRKCLEILEEDTPGSGDSGTKINKKNYRVKFSNLKSVSSSG